MIEIIVGIFILVLLILSLYLLDSDRKRIVLLEKAQADAFKHTLLVQKESFRLFQEDKEKLLFRISDLEKKLAKIEGILERTLTNYRSAP